MRILQINTSDARGGAHRVSFELHETYRARGHDAWLAVGIRRTDDPHVIALSNDRGRQPSHRGALARHVGNAFSAAAEPGRTVRRHLGREDFDFPASRRVADDLELPPDVVHCHNLHGNYFDLRALPTLSNRFPVFLTLHDAWLLSGHCAHSFDCDRWTTGCGSCPDLTIYPPIRRDSTAVNWRRKREIFAQSRLYVAAPCRWMIEKVERSMLAEGVVETEVIPYGVNADIFAPGDRLAARQKMGLPLGSPILMFAATGIRDTRWRDYNMLREAVRAASEALDQEVLLLAVGETGDEERLGRATVRFVPYVDTRTLVEYYRAADAYLHPAVADTFPNTVLEAMACGTPVVATTVGGIPEQVTDTAGILVSPGDARAMAEATVAILLDPGVAARYRTAAVHAAGRFDYDEHATRYLDWYADVLDRREHGQLASPGSRPA